MKSWAISVVVTLVLLFVLHICFWELTHPDEAMGLGYLFLQALVIIVVVLFQIFQLLFTALSSSFKFKYSLLFTGAYSLISFIAFLFITISLVQAKNILTEIADSSEQESNNINPYFGYQTLFVIPVILQTALFIFLYRKQKIN